MSSLPAIGGHKAEIAIKPEYIVSSSSGYYPVKSEEVETDNEEDTNTSKNEHNQHINIKVEQNIKVEVKTEDDDVSTDDEGIISNNKSTAELQSSQLADTQATSKAIAEKKSNGGCWIDHIEWSASKDYDRLAIIQQKNAKTKEDRKEANMLRQRIRGYKTQVMEAELLSHKGRKRLLSYLDAKDQQLASSQMQVVAKTKRKYEKISKNKYNSANSFWKLDDTRSRAEEAIRQRVGYCYHAACDKRVCITTYSISHIKKMMTIKGPLYYDSFDFTRFCTKFKEIDLDIVYPKVDGRGELFPPPQYLARGELIRKWRQFSEVEQLNICNNHILPSDEDEEAPPPVEPLTLPKDYMGTISDKKIDELALKVNLRRLLSLTGHIDLNPTLLHTSIKAPIHVTGCSRNWGVVLHSIRYFYELDKAQQLEEVWKERFLLRAQRSHYKANIRHLHKHRTSIAKTKDNRALDQARQALDGQANEKALQARKAYLDRYW